MPLAGRYQLAPSATRWLLPRQLGWSLWQGAALGALTATGAAASQPALAVAGAMGLAAAGAFPDRLHRAAPVALATVAGAGLTGLLADTSAAVSGLQILVAGAILGAGIGWLERSSPDPWHLAQTALAGTALAGIGWWAADRLLGGLPTQPLLAALHAAIMGIMAAQVLVVAALRYRAVERIPSPSRIRATLRPVYQPPGRQAARVGRESAESAPDPELRDGLGEVAAWIYKLHWSLQSLEREMEAASPVELQQRIVRLYEEAEQSSDAFTRERRLATAAHLEQLARHHDALLVERQRLVALIDYASAYQEEARAGLVLSRLKPGDYTPLQLDDVLQRLRDHAQHQRAQQHTAREVAPL